MGLSRGLATKEENQVLLCLPLPWGMYEAPSSLLLTLDTFVLTEFTK